MNFGLVIRYVGLVMLLNAAFMFLSAVVSAVSGMDTGFYPLALSCLITTVIGCFPMIFVPAEKNLSIKESYLIVVLSWIMSCLLGMLPYLVWGGEFTLIDAWFESSSGFSTTGATILNDIEALPRGLLFWRASTHWIGGVGVVLFALVILPSVGRTKMSLSSVEISTLAKDNFQYNTRKILRVIIFVYVGLTLLQSLVLACMGMGIFDAVTNSFSTIATGGFCVRNLSIMYYNSAAIEMVMLFFMVISGMHMGLIYATVAGKRNNLFRSEVARFYVISLVICTLFVSYSLLSSDTFDTVGDSLRYGAFQVAAYTTTTGFASTDASLWPPLAVVVLIYCSIQCAMAGSTTGGIKADRMLLVFKTLRARVLQLQHPNAVVRIKQNGIVQEDSIVNTALLLIVIYMVSVLAGTLALTAMNIDLTTSFTATIACLSNVGPGFGAIGNLENYDLLPGMAKVLLSWLMLFGRLEFFGLIHIFMLRSWK